MTFLFNYFFTEIYNINYCLEMCNVKLLYQLPFILKIVHVVICENVNEQEDKNIDDEGSNSKYWNFIVQVVDGNNLCGGALITLNCVVSSANCVANMRRRDISITPAFHDASQGIQVKAKTVLIHPKYVNPKKNDIAIVKLQTYINSPSVSTINGASGETAAGTICHIAGWGSDYHTPEEKITEIKANTLSTTSVKVPVVEETKGRIIKSDALREQTIRIIQESNCQANFIKQMHVCVMTLVNGTDVCFNNSGSFLVCDNKLVGISSFLLGTVCGSPGNHLVFTNQSRFSKWIKQSGCNNDVDIDNDNRHRIVTATKSAGAADWGGDKPVYGSLRNPHASRYFKDIYRINPFFSSYCLVLILSIFFS